MHRFWHQATIRTQEKGGADEKLKKHRGWMMQSE
jgi:hypothetical protein